MYSTLTTDDGNDGGNYADVGTYINNYQYYNHMSPQGLHSSPGLVTGERLEQSERSSPSLFFLSIHPITALTEHGEFSRKNCHENEGNRAREPKTRRFAINRFGSGYICMYVMHINFI